MKKIFNILAWGTMAASMLTSCQMMEDDGRSADYIASHQMTMADVITVCRSA